MNNNEMRKLDENVLKKVVGKLNADFIKDLPITAEELFEFAKRRIEPQISSNISYDLGKRMLESRLSDEDYFITFLKAIQDVFYAKEAEDGSIQTHILVSQTGGGKTNLRKLLLNKDKNMIIVNPDLYKKFRPDATKIMKEDPTCFGALTGIDSYDHASNILDFAIAKKYNLLLECAPSTQNGLIGVDLKKLNENGYETQFDILSVGDLISSIAIHKRYEIELRQKNKGAKLTDLKRHNDSYEAVEEIIKELPPKKINIYRRGTDIEKQVPVLINGDSNKTNIYSLEKLKEEREKSNTEYSKSNFGIDYKNIYSQMKERNAPKEQFEQLEEVYDKYLNYIGRKFMEEER